MICVIKNLAFSCNKLVDKFLEAGSKHNSQSHIYGSIKYV